MHRIATAQPFHNSYLFRCIGQPSRGQLFWPGNIYVPTGMEVPATDVSKICNIMADQFLKFREGESSIFSPGIWSFPPNLIIKNLSFEEIKVIVRYSHIRLGKYYAIVGVYYHTYKLAINIANDGERNAKRHAFWVISMYRKFGEDFAREISKAHERGRPGSPLDNCVDAFNNKAATKYAKDNPGEGPAEAARNMWARALLLVEEQIPYRSLRHYACIFNFKILFVCRRY